MILLDEKVAVNLIMILLYIILILHLINVLIYCFYALKKEEEPLCSYFWKNDVQIFSLTLILNHLEKVIEAL